MSRIVFCGQKPVGERCFGLLLERAGDQLEVCGAVSNPDGSPWWGSAGVRERADREGIPFLSNAERNEEELAAIISAGGADTLLSVQHPWVIPERVLDAVSMRAFNLHNAPLPGYKGYNAANHAILNGEAEFAATVHWMAPKVDGGPIAFEERFPVAESDTARSLHARAADAGVAAFGRLVEALAECAEIPSRPLGSEGSFYARDSLEGLRRIQNPEDQDELDRKARAFHFPPFEPAYVVVDGRKHHVVPGDG